MPSATVVGAGIGGLATAGALARAGWEVSLLERRDRLKSRGAATVLWPNGIRALAALGLAGGLDAVTVPLAPAGLRRPTGDWLVPPAETPTGAVLLHDDALHDALMAGLGDKVTIRTGADAVKGRADLVVAADGAESRLRAELTPGCRFVSTGFAAWRAVVPWYRAPALDAPGDLLGSGHRFSFAPIGDRGVAFVATVPGARRPEPAPVQLGLLRRWFAGWAEPVPQLLAAAEPGDLVHDAVGEVSPVPPSFAPRPGHVLLGDAAHAMTHHLGQGACLALEDAATLATELTRGELEPALAAYSALRRPRVMRVLAQSRRVGALLAPRGRFGLRNRFSLIDRAAGAASQWELRPL